MSNARDRHDGTGDRVQDPVVTRGDPSKVTGTFEFDRPCWSGVGSEREDGSVNLLERPGMWWSALECPKVSRCSRRDFDPVLLARHSLEAEFAAEIVVGEPLSRFVQCRAGSSTVPKLVDWDRFRQHERRG